MGDMEEYLIYYLDGSGRIFRRSVITVRNDLDALAQGVAACRSDNIEIWQGARLIAKINKAQFPGTNHDA
jgi:hypothetical protein